LAGGIDMLNGRTLGCALALALLVPATSQAGWRGGTKGNGKKAKTTTATTTTTEERPLHEEPALTKRQAQALAHLQTANARTRAVSPTRLRTAVMEIERLNVARFDGEGRFIEDGAPDRMVFDEFVSTVKARLEHGETLGFHADDVMFRLSRVVDGKALV